MDHEWKINLWLNFADNSSDSMDLDGRRSHVAGTIGAVGNNRIGITGAALASMSSSQNLVLMLLRQLRPDLQIIIRLPI